MQFALGHGTGNDFVLLPDVEGELDLTPGLVQALCDRRQGFGGDGVLRIVPTAKVPEGVGLASDSDWFMDYRNADGSVAEMCGNGIRVYARWLREAGLVGPGALPVATRDGVKHVVVPEDPEGDIAVDMGGVTVGGTRRVSVEDWSGEGLEVSLGNPHVVVAVPSLESAGRLERAPVLDPVGEANVEFVVVRGEGHLALRVFERGVGETQSCGTGACAAVVASAVRAGRSEQDSVVDVPGGRLHVRWTRESLVLSGPAEIIGTGQVDSAWLAARLS